MTVGERTKPRPRLTRIAALLPLAAVLTLGDVALSASSGNAAAQGFGNLFDRVFGARQSRPAYREGPRNYQPPPRYYIDPPASPRQRPKAGAPRPSTSAKRPAGRREGATATGLAQAGPVAAPVEKAADAKTVLVVGDFMALSLAKGLEASTAANAAVRVKDRTDGSSGLVRDDHLDWPARIGAIVDEEKPAVVLVMLGSNDRQAIRMDAGSEDVRSEAWTAEYTRRMNALAEAVSAKKLPLIWVGLPAFKSARTNDDVAYFNELYRQAAVDVGGEFVDVWDGFVDASGAFASSGPDVAGQPARLRNSDGITMTPQGARKLAFFAEKPLEKVLGQGLAGTVLAALPDEKKALPQNPANATAVPAVAMNSPSLDGGESLIAGPPVPRADGTTPSPRELLVDAGASPAPSTGRADDFAWDAKVGPMPGRPDTPIVSRGSLDLGALRSGAGTALTPQPMPSLEDAIIDDWTAREKAEAARRAAGDASPQLGPTQPGSAVPR